MLIGRESHHPEAGQRFQLGRNRVLDEMVIAVSYIGIN